MVSVLTLLKRAVDAENSRGILTASSKAYNSVGECLVYTEKVGGSNPSMPTYNTMTEADGVKAQITIAIDMAERVQAAQLAYQQAVHDLQGAVILLDLTADNPYSRSSMRMAPLIGRGIIDDMEITGQVKSNLQEWFQKL
jgi:hypothetical protein